MTALITGLLADYWQQIAGTIAVIAGAAGLYFKGRGDATSKAKLEDVTNANQIRRDGAAARAGAHTDRLRDDGFRRD